jgi:hypothetical protein
MAAARTGAWLGRVHERVFVVQVRKNKMSWYFTCQLIWIASFKG